MQEFLHKCLDSLIVPGEQLEALDILIINDGSQDNSSRIAHEYETKYPNVFRVIDKENGNYGSCINRGLTEAKGKFIKILDADDWFDTYQFGLYLALLEKIDKNVDLVLTDYNRVDNKGSIIAKCKYNLPCNSVFSFQDYHGLDYFAHHSITYRTQFLRDISFEQTEGISYTDTEWVFYPQLYAKKCIYKNIVVYQYLLGREGQTMDPKVRLKGCIQMTTILQRMILTLASLPEENKNGGGYQRLSSFVAHESKGIYSAMLVKASSRECNLDLLTSYDEFLKKENNDLYDSIGQELVLKGIPIHYVLFWRKHHKRFPVDTIRSFYRKIKYGCSD
jgi:glycosyltransferase involved in cell wall biosynthesis